MEYTAPRPRSVDLWRVVSIATLAGLYSFFAWVNFQAWRETGRPVGLGLMAQEALVAVLFVVRRQPRSSSRSLIAWIATGIGSFGILFVRPDYAPVLGLGWLWMAMQVVGMACAVVSLGCLGRSFGLVAANRGVKDGGAYRVVRHPAYASYFIAHVGYILENPSPWNIGILLTVFAVQLARIHQEEAHLSADPAYRAYQARVRYRLIPFVY